MEWSAPFAIARVGIEPRFQYKRGSARSVDDENHIKPGRSLNNKVVRI